jgi:hypothetical protein
MRGYLTNSFGGTVQGKQLERYGLERRPDDSVAVPLAGITSLPALTTRVSCPSVACLERLTQQFRCLTSESKLIFYDLKFLKSGTCFHNYHVLRKRTYRCLDLPFR